MIGAAPGANRALWLDQFHAFSLVHLSMLLGLAAIMCVVVAAGRRMRGGAGARMMDRSLACLGALAWVIVAVWWLSPSRFTWGNSLPLQLCDLAGLVAPLAIWKRYRWARSLLYFWGIGL